MFHDVRGGLAAGILFVLPSLAILLGLNTPLIDRVVTLGLPSLAILLGLNTIYVTFGKILWVSALFQGLKPAVVAIVAVALMKIGKKSLQSTLHYLIAIASFIAIYFQHPFSTDHSGCHWNCIGYPLACICILPDGINGGFHYMNFAWIFISFLAMFRFKVNMMLWIGISALFSLLVYFIM